MVKAGLPNITGSGIIYASTDINTGAFSQTIGDNKKRSGTNENNNGNYGGFEFDASRSNLIYGNSNTVQPQSVSCYLEFYLN